MPIGSISYTPKQQERYRERKEAESKKQHRKQAKNELGQFYFMSSAETYEIKPQTMARLIYLGTYIRYGSNELYATQRTPLKKSDLPELMGLSRGAFYEFWDEVADIYVFEDKTGRLTLSEQFRRGELTKYLQEQDGQQAYQQFYIMAVRKLYKETPATKHCYLGYVFEMLPYINQEYNILCWNADETDLDRIDLMTLDEWCDLIGYSKENQRKLIKIYAMLTFEWMDKKQRLCSFVTGDFTTGSMRIFINPHILYRGSDWRKVEAFGLFFRDDEPKKKQNKKRKYSVNIQKSNLCPLIKGMSKISR